MNTAADILSYAQTHDINLIAEDGQLKIDAPETALTDDFLESAKQHKSELLLFAIVSGVCNGIEITPQQFNALLTAKDKELILSGDVSQDCLSAYAASFAEGIKSGRIVFHPTTKKVIRHN